MNKDILMLFCFIDDCIVCFGSIIENYWFKWCLWFIGLNIDGIEILFFLCCMDIDLFEYVNNIIYWYGVYEIFC